MGSISASQGACRALCPDASRAQGPNGAGKALRQPQSKQIQSFHKKRRCLHKAVLSSRNVALFRTKGLVEWTFFFFLSLYNEILGKTELVVVQKPKREDEAIWWKRSRRSDLLQPDSTLPLPSSSSCPRASPLSPLPNPLPRCTIYPFSPPPWHTLSCPPTHCPHPFYQH